MLSGTSIIFLASIFIANEASNEEKKKYNEQCCAPFTSCWWVWSMVRRRLPVVHYVYICYIVGNNRLCTAVIGGGSALSSPSVVRNQNTHWLYVHNAVLPWPHAVMKLCRQQHWVEACVFTTKKTEESIIILLLLLYGMEDITEMCWEKGSKRQVNRVSE